MLTINSSRLLANLEELGQIGAAAAGGVSRPALSQADVAGRDWFKRRVLAAGLQFRADGAGNLSALLPAQHSEAKTVLAGSHLDTVPNGGRFDGALGVLCALEALQTIKEAGVKLPCHLEAISFTDEEGAVVSMLGSRALTGQLTPADLRDIRQPGALDAGLRRLKLTRADVLAAGRNPATLAGFVELHIEQGRRLESQQLDLGVVTAIVGIRSFWLHFTGQAGHAGTTPLAARADALRGAAAFVLAAQQLVQERHSPGVMNCGQIQVEPGSFNIIPARVRLALEFRHGTEAELEAMQADLLTLAGTVAGQHGLEFSSEAVDACRAAAMDAALIGLVERTAAELGLTSTRLLSFAGHDSQTMSAITPTALFFVPSVNGISHNPAEFTHPKDVVNGANVLLHTLLQLAGRCSD